MVFSLGSKQLCCPKKGENKKSKKIYRDSEGVRAGTKAGTGLRIRVRVERWNEH